MEVSKLLALGTEGGRCRRFCLAQLGESGESGSSCPCFFVDWLRGESCVLLAFESVEYESTYCREDAAILIF